ncbi:MAG TPA: carboxypeptidase-like regulatory domain-containing protein, partial [Edaphobacter sp.]|nr:carboxypeptidase-like regulatory domain-containing protein [Edaphobacter sp.]
MHKNLFRFFSLAILFACVSPHVIAQAFSGLSGTVSDNSKSVISGAKVTVRNNANASERTTITNSSGFYTFPSLEAGTYMIRVESAGFQTQVIDTVTLKAASSSGVDFTLSVGNANETISVTTDIPELDRTNTSLGDTINEKQIQELPINGRDYARLSLVTPGAVARSRYISDISFDGLHSVHNQFSIDGVDASRVDQPYMANGYERGARLLTGSLETIQEFRAQTSGYPAEYGRAAGSLVNIVTKSGSNQFHGEVYDFFRNEALDASNYFA